MNTVFICLNDDGSIMAGTKAEVDNAIKEYEDIDQDLPFKVIGKLKDPHIRMDFDPTQIEWYEKDEKSKAFIDKAVIAIMESIKELQYKFRK